ncbi:MAG: two pore domain potassium channel family protein [Spirochaetaceae bacterium]|nr:two pore domain potassium channel family protein [Spirochaetaceae bacterium]
MYINNYRDALWYCYAVFSTAGFGDLVAVTVIGRILSILLTVYTILIVAIVTGVVVAFYNEVVSIQYKASKAEVIDKLENLEKLTTEELAELSEKIRKIV